MAATGQELVTLKQMKDSISEFSKIPLSDNDVLYEFSNGYRVAPAVIDTNTVVGAAVSLMDDTENNVSFGIAERNGAVIPSIAAMNHNNEGVVISFERDSKTFIVMQAIFNGYATNAIGLDDYGKLTFGSFSGTGIIPQTPDENSFGLVKPDYKTIIDDGNGTIGVKVASNNDFRDYLGISS